MTMTTLYTIHATDATKLDEVINEMKILGNPEIRVVNCGDFLMALEGTHRVEAAAQLGLPINMLVLEQDALVLADSLDWQDLCPGQSYTAGELAGEAFSPSCSSYRINDDGSVSRI